MLARFCFAKSAVLLLACPLLAALLVMGGCNEPAGDTRVDPAKLAAATSAITLAEEPKDPVTPLDLREQEGGFTSGEVVLVGQVGGVANPWKETEPNFPYKKGEATFFLVDPGAAAAHADHTSGDPDHDETCPFCASHAGDNVPAIAVVTFADESGKPRPYGAELLGIGKDQIVVVKGQAQLAGEVMIVEADGIYIRD